jgi:hypothetical protein
MISLILKSYQLIKFYFILLKFHKLKIIQFIYHMVLKDSKFNQLYITNDFKEAFNIIYAFISPDLSLKF